LIDLGSSFHITPHREWFMDYENHMEAKYFLDMF
jgi:hypothetical protein